MKVTIVKHGERYEAEYDWPAHIDRFSDFLAHHGYVVVLYDKDDFQRNSLITDVTVFKRPTTESDDAHPAFWLTVWLGEEMHDVLCWSIVDLFEMFDMLKLLPNV